jgi:antitoxin YefM
MPSSDPNRAALMIKPATSAHAAVGPLRWWTSATSLVILVTMSETMALAEVKAHLSQLVSRVNAHHDRVTVTVHGRPSAVLLSVDDLEALEETIAILSDSDALRQLAASEAELARGEGETEQDLADAMRRRRPPA